MRANANWRPTEGSAARGARKSAEARARRDGVRHGEGHPATSDPDYSPEELEFIGAMRSFQERTGRKFPTWSEALRVLRSLGYARVPA